jgi:two-component system chemotaxis response regulator CheB
MPGHDVIVIGASAGGVGTLATIIAGLPEDLPAAVFVVLHIPPHSRSLLPAILNRCGRLDASHADDGEPIRPGRIYIAPPDNHLLIQNGTARLGHGPKENACRPAVDTLFRSAARWYGPRVVGVVLSGSLDDGTAGLLAIKRRGGVTVAQDPGEALYESMPRSAIDNDAADHVLPATEIAPFLADLARRPPAEGGADPMPDDMDIEAEMAALDMDALQSDQRPGTPSGFTCPDCHGALWELHDGELIRFRCRVGHAFSPDSLLAQQSSALEEALWSAFRALKESAALARRLAERLRRRGNSVLSVARFEEQAAEAEQRAAFLRQILLKGELNAPPQAAGTDPPPSPGQNPADAAGAAPGGTP